MSSNSKSKNPTREAPTEPFKRAVAGCLRAIAKRPELEVGFAAERPGLAAGKARLPEPPRKLSTREAAIVRGHADSIALRLACHNPAVHRRLMPGGQQARAVFESVEQARVEAIGARRMEGVARNLSAMLEGILPVAIRSMNWISVCIKTSHWGPNQGSFNFEQRPLTCSTKRTSAFQEALWAVVPSA